MSGNSFGKIFRLTSFGESHGTAIGGVIDGCPAGLTVDYFLIEQQLNKRKADPLLVNHRKETDNVVFLSGIYQGKTTGTPIGFMMTNQDVKSDDYAQQAEILRPSHADFVYRKKYGIYDHCGSGRASARETAVRVVGGCFAQMLLNRHQIEIKSFTIGVGRFLCDSSWGNLPLKQADKNPLHCPDEALSTKMLAEIQNAADDGDTVGCTIGCVMSNVPIGLGSPIFDKLSADLAKAMFSINAVKGFEIGGGFAMCQQYGSEVNDLFKPNGGTQTNFSGGIQAGISNGEDIYCSVAFKPLPTLMRVQETIDIHNQSVLLQSVGRHDVCAAPRVRVVIEAMAAMTIADHLLLHNSYKN